MPNGNGTIIKTLAQAGLAGVCLGLIILVGFIVKINYQFIANALNSNTQAFNELNITLKSKGVVAELRAHFTEPVETERVSLPEDAVQKLFPVKYDSDFLPKFAPPLAQIVVPEKPKGLPISNDPATIEVLESMGIPTTTVPL